MLATHRMLIVPLRHYWGVEQRRRNKESMPKWWTYVWMDALRTFGIFSGLPTVLKQHIQSYHKSTLPTHRCVICGRCCWDDLCGYVGCMNIWQYEFSLECVSYDPILSYIDPYLNPIIYHIKRGSAINTNGWSYNTRIG
jgi:hypothetical protein